MRVRIEIDNPVSARLSELAGSPLSKARRRLIEEAMKESLQDVIGNSPVETGRSRAAWVNGLEQLGGSAPSGREGPDRSAIQEGRRLGRLTRVDADDVTALTAHNGVSYVRYLEYGTTRMAPFALVRRALLKVSRRVAALFRLR